MISLSLPYVIIIVYSKQDLLILYLQKTVCLTDVCNCQIQMNLMLCGVVLCLPFLRFFVALSSQIICSF